jgi:hypothetical protein
MAIRMQQRRGTASQWVSTNDGDGPILNPGEIGFESDTGRFKIGDGTNHWIDLDYFLDESELTSSLDGYIPESLLGANNGVAQLNSSGKLVSDQIPNIDEITQDAIDSALIAGTGLDKTYNDNANTITLDIDSTVATKSFAASLLTGATKSNITITGDENGLTISAENGVADSNTDNLTEGSTNKYFTDERAQDAVGNAVGTGLSYDDASGAVSVNTTTIQARVADVSDTEIGYLNGVTSSIQTQMDAKAPLASPTFTGTVTLPANTISQSMMGDDSVGTNELGGLAVTEAKIADGAVTNAKVSASAAIAQSKIDGLTTDLAAKAPLAGPTFTGAVTLPGDPSSSLHAATKQYVDNTASGVVAKPQVLGATTANIDATYNNGTAGVGATLTHNTNGAFPAEAGGASGWAVGKGILVKNQTNKAQNGRYYISDMGSVSTPYVLTRCTYCDEASEIPGAYIFVQDGTIAGTGWIQVVADPATFVVGTDNIDVFQFSGSGTITAGNGISVSGNEVSINTSVTQTRVENVSDTEIGYLNGVTSAIQTQLDDKQPKVSGVSDTEIGYLDGVTSAIQTQLNAKQATVSGVSDTEIGYLDGVTSAIQTQLDAKIAKADIAAKGAILVGTGSGTYLSQSVGTNGQVLTADSAETDGVKWATPAAGYSAPTLGSTSIASGATVTNVAGLTINSTTIPSSATLLTSGGALGTPSSGTLTSATGLPISSGVSGLGTGVATFLGTPSSANFASMITDEVGTGNVLLSDLAISAQSASYTLVLADRGKLVEISNGSANNLTVPANSSVAFPVGTQIHILQTGAGQTTVVAAGGVTINPAATLKLRQQWSAATLVKRATNTWILMGDISA